MLPLLATPLEDRKTMLEPDRFPTEVATGAAGDGLGARNVSLPSPARSVQPHGLPVPAAGRPLALINAVSQK